jgi:hypothetical protein
MMPLPAPHLFLLKHPFLRQRSQLEGPGSAQPRPAGAAARRSGKSAVFAQRAAALPPFFSSSLPAQKRHKARSLGLRSPFIPANWSRFP